MYSEAAFTPGDKAIIDFDFDNSFKVAAILEDEVGQRTIEVDGHAVLCPSIWTKHMGRIRCAEQNAIVVWPICRRNEGDASVAKIKIWSQLTHLTLQIGHPLDIFIHDDRLVCTPAEDSDP